ncbi:MAG: hypothetical protein QOJ20_5831 [Mycobacterium sp.]|nr:hypothetical protein [Mycobacterium sp.]
MLLTGEHDQRSWPTSGSIGLGAGARHSAAGAVKMSRAACLVPKTSTSPRPGSEVGVTGSVAAARRRNYLSGSTPAGGRGQ